ncbi:MAG: hypothetical protein WBP44_00240, partial [Gammaproteobacteria bacterium]
MNKSRILCAASSLSKKLVLVSIVIVTPITSFAAPITINFDELGTSSVTVGDYYLASGVTFEDAITTGSLTGGSGTTAIFHATNTNKPQPDNPIAAIFSSSVSSVSLTGLDVGTAGFLFSAYDVSDSLLGTTQITP